jgi:hypothetical protein
MHGTCVTNTLSTNKVLHALGLCHLPVLENCTRTVRNFIRCVPTVTVKGRNDTKIKQFFTYYLIQCHLMLYDRHFWMTRRRKGTNIRQVFAYYLIQRHLMLYEWYFLMARRRKSTNIRQVFTYYLIQRHLMLYDWHFWTTRRRKDTSIRQVFTYYLIQRHLMLYDWHFPKTWKSHKVIYPNKYLQYVSIPDGWTQVMRTLRYVCTLVRCYRKTRFSYYSQ